MEFSRNYSVTIVAIASALAFGVAGFYITRQTTGVSVPRDVLVVGIMSGYEPYASMNECGDFEGFDIDVAKELAQRLNRKLMFKDMSMASLVIALQQGNIDLLLSACSITQDRKKKLALVYYQGDPVRSFPLLFWGKIPVGVKGIGDLATLKNPVVCTEAGTKKEQFLQQFSFLQVKSMSGISDIIMDLKFGKSVAVMLDPEVVPLLKKKNPELVTLEIPVPEEYQSEGFGIGINKNNRALVADIEKNIELMRADGTLKALEQKWFKE